MQKSIVNRPKALVCYICGREYGTASLPIHLKTCKEKWDIEENKKPKNKRRPCPQPPQGFDQLLTKGGNKNDADFEKFNNQAFTKYNEEALVPCVNCGRTFLPDSLVHHQKACKKDNPFKAGAEKTEAADMKRCSKCKMQFHAERLAKHELVCGKEGQQDNAQNSQKDFSSGEKIARPKTLICYICGREYGTKSLGIHIKVCQEKFINEESKKQKKDRRDLPQPPQGLMELLEKENITQEDIEQYNNKAFKKYNVESLVTCKNCSRTFKPEALEHHKKACTADKPFKPLDRAEGDSENPSENAAELEQCSKCGRKFTSDRIAKHEAVCKGDGAPGSQTQPVTKQKVEDQKRKIQEEQKQSIPVRPKTIICYICGREYGTQSLKIHIKACEQKWEIEESKKPPKQRRPIPQPPKGFAEIAENGGQMNMDAFEQYNNQAFDKYNKESLVPCPNCNRTFKPESLAHHQKACTSSNPLKPLSQTSANSAQNSTSPATTTTNSQQKPSQVIPEYAEEEGQLNECSKCGRKFNDERLKKHESVCKGPTQSLAKKHQNEEEEEKQHAQTVKPQKEKEKLWKAQHDDFIKNMQYNKKLAEVEKNGGDIRQLGPPPVSKADKNDFVQCPYCLRSFNQQASERHISICKNVINKPKQPPGKPALQSQSIFQSSNSTINKHSNINNLKKGSKK